MAQQTTVRFIDDLDESDAAETVSFALDNKTYEIDLNEANAAKLRDALAPFITAGRRARATQGLRASTPVRGNADKAERTEYLKRVRVWAREQGVEISDRGRVSEDVQRRYQEAQQGGNGQGNGVVAPQFAAAV
jgi:hypothetical protein